MDARRRTTRTAVRSPLELLSPLRDFLRTETAGGVLLGAGALAALVWANSPWQGAYRRLWSSQVAVEVAGHVLRLDLKHWIDDGMMAVFFLVVGLEIKRELTSGHLATRRTAALPIAAALGGMVVPALLYLVIAGRAAAHGWAVPMATDIALALGVVALAGPRVPPSQRAFLLGLAIVDDIGAIVVIAAFYSEGVAWRWLALALGCVAVTLVLRRLRVDHVVAYVAIGVGMWFALHEAGVHPTLAGVAMGLLAPGTPKRSRDLIDVDELTDLSSVEAARTTVDLARDTVSVVEWLQHVLHPWTSYVIVPVFALANAGIEITAHGLRHSARSAITWGIVVGLVVGKPVGIRLATRAAVASGLAVAPAGSTRRAATGIAAAGGIGFTVALFISELAYGDDAHRSEAKLAVLVGSVVAALVATALLRSGRSAGVEEAAVTATPSDPPA
jgi:NhaA family Na+:H+ antiporter